MRRAYSALVCSDSPSSGSKLVIQRSPYAPTSPHLRRHLLLSLMFRLTALGPPRAHGRDIGAVPVLLRPVGLGGELHERVQRDLHPRALALVHVHEVGEDAADDGLVRHDDDVLAALELHDDRLQSNDDVTVRLAAAVAVVVLVVVARAKVFRVLVLDLLVGHAVADARLELVERLPLEYLPARLGG